MEVIVPYYNSSVWKRNRKLGQGAGHGPYSTTETINKSCDDYQRMRQEQKMEEYVDRGRE